MTDAEVTAGWEQDAHVRSAAMRPVRSDHEQARALLREARHWLWERSSPMDGEAFADGVLLKERIDALLPPEDTKR